MTNKEFKDLRLQLHMTQVEMAFALGCSRRSMINYELGINPIPKYVALAVAAYLYKLPPYGSSD